MEPNRKSINTLLCSWLFSKLTFGALDALGTVTTTGMLISLVMLVLLKKQQRVRRKRRSTSDTLELFESTDHMWNVFPRGPKTTFSGHRGRIGKVTYLLVCGNRKYAEFSFWLLFWSYCIVFTLRAKSLIDKCLMGLMVSPLSLIGEVCCSVPVCTEFSFCGYWFLTNYSLADRGNESDLIEVRFLLLPFICTCY